MKLSLNWLADHLSSDWHMPSLSQLVHVLIRHVAEVDDAYTVTIERDKLYAAVIRESHDATISAYIPEIDMTVSLPHRDVPYPHAYYLVYRDGAYVRWCRVTDIGGGKHALCPAVAIQDEQARDGSWRNMIPEQDHIIEVDNAAITHRADLWGHRGFAREIDAIYNYEDGTSKLRSSNELYTDILVEHADRAPQHQYAPRIASDACDRCVTYYIPHIDARPSALCTMVRLACVGVNPHSLLVDLTNYVMYDIGQPMHAFDADELQESSIVVRNAHEHESLNALDGTDIDLSSRDMVVASGNQTLSVAGVIGGAATGVHSETQSIVLEAAHFDPGAIRHTSSRIKRRTESSMRFEKNVDPYATHLAIQRYCHLLSQHGVAYHATQTAYADGALPEHTDCTVKHAYIVQRIGLEDVIQQHHIVAILELLGCSVTVSDQNESPAYHITIPSYRRNDITRAEDVIEEVARIVGYDHIPFRLPQRPMYPYSLQKSYRIRTVKQHLAYALSMHEVVSYALYDEQWLHTLQWNTHNSVTIANPVSEHMYRLVTSLMPHMLYAVANNVHMHREVRFFEWAKVWQYNNENAHGRDAVQEDEVLAGIIYRKNDTYDFYHLKSDLHSLFSLVQMSVAWKPIPHEAEVPQWCDVGEAAYIMYRYRGNWYHLGTAGRIHGDMLARVAEGAAYGFELNGEALRTFIAPNPVFAGISKYQQAWFDVSMYVPSDVTVAELEDTIRKSDHRIQDVYLVDIYEQSGGSYPRSITLRVSAGHSAKTLSAEEVAAIREKVYACVQAYKVYLR